MRATVKDARTNNPVGGLENVSLNNALVVRLSVPSKPGVYYRTLYPHEQYVVVVEEGDPDEGR